jgi:uncharacterized protein (TIGR03067 family)
MKKALLGMLVVGLLVAADDKKDDVKDKLKGTWTVVAMEEGGKKAPEEQFKGMTLTFEGDKVTFKHGNDTKMGTFKVDAGEKPGHLDITPSDGPEKGKTMKMIFMLDGDTLTIGGAKKDEGPRPKSFDDAHGKITLKREKK